MRRMHTKKFGGFVIHHSGDFSGEIIVVGEIEHIQPEIYHPNKTAQIRLPIEVLEFVVAEKIRAERINNLEQMDAREVLGLE